jgi:LuxR family maltose regulon positive regulatory protein
MLGVARQMCGQQETAIQALKQRLAEADPSDTLYISRLIAGLAFIFLLSGELTQAGEVLLRLDSLARKRGLSYTHAWSSYMLAWVHFHSHDLAGALAGFELSAEKLYIGNIKLSVDFLAGLALTYQAMCRPNDANEAMSRLLEFAREMDDPLCLFAARSCEARLALLQGDLTSAVRWAGSYEERPDPSTLFFWLEAPSITKARALIADGSEQSLLNATKLLQSIRDLCEACRFTCQIIEVAVLQSVALDKLGQDDEALATLEEVVTLAGPLGWIRPFIEAGSLMAGLLKRLHKQNVAVEYIEKILAACRDDEQFLVQRAAEQPMGSPRHPLRSSSFSQPMIEPLTQRELDVLELLFERLRNKEIAEKLFISNDTIKWHLKNIYQKLGVNNRRQAVERAKNLGFFV